MKGGHFAEKQIVPLTSADIWNRTTKLIAENRLVMKWGKRCDSKQIFMFLRRPFEMVSLSWCCGKEPRRNTLLSMLSDSLFFSLFVCFFGFFVALVTRHWRKRSLLTLPHAKEDTVKYHFQARCALCAWQQWQPIYLYPEKERTIILYLIYC